MANCRLTLTTSVVDLGTKLDLHYLATHLWNTEYVPTQNAAVQMQMRNPKCKINIYASGKMTSIGGCSPNDSERAMRQAAKMIRAVGYQETDTAADQEEKRRLRAPRASAIVFRDFAITNLAGIANYGQRLRLEAIASTYEDICTYEPEIGAALDMHLTAPVDCQFRIFQSGKILIPKVPSYDDCKRAIATLWQMLDGFVAPTTDKDAKNSHKSAKYKEDDHDDDDEEEDDDRN